MSINDHSRRSTSVLPRALIHVPYFRPNRFEFGLHVLCICDARLYLVAKDPLRARNKRLLVLSELIVSPSGEYASSGISITNSNEAVATAFMRRFRVVPDCFFEFYPARGQNLTKPLAPGNHEFFSKVLTGVLGQVFEGNQPAFHINRWEPATRGQFEHLIGGRFELPYLNRKFSEDDVRLIWVGGTHWKRPLTKDLHFNALNRSNEKAR